VKACVALLDDPDLSTRKIMASIKGPDLPTGGEIVSPRDELVRMYETVRAASRRGPPMRSRTARS